jgi:hypothetical protein
MTSNFFPVPARTIAQAAAAAEMKTVDCPNVICMARSVAAGALRGIGRNADRVRKPRSGAMAAGRASAVALGWCVVAVEQVEQRTDLVAELGAVAHRHLAVDLVAVAPADSDAVDVARFDEVGEDPLRRPLGDPDFVGDVAQTYLRILSQAQQNLCVVGDERPGFFSLVS